MAGDDSNSGWLSEPAKKQATIVIDYWWCGAKLCTQMHKTQEIAMKCAMRRRTLRRGVTESDRNVWKMVVEDGVRQVDAARSIGISANQVQSIIEKFSRQLGIKTYHQPEGVRMIDWVRQQAKLVAPLTQQASDDLPANVFNALSNYLSADVTPELLARVSYSELKDIYNLGKIGRTETIQWMKANGYWSDWPAR